MEPLILTTNDIDEPRYLRHLVPGVTDEAPQVLDIYTGWLKFDFSVGGVLTRQRVVSWVPLAIHGGKADVQTYPQGAEAIVTASLSSFGHSAQAACVDRAFIATKTQPLTHKTLKPVLVLTVDVAAHNGSLLRIAYQVTVLAQTTNRGKEFPTLVEEIDLTTPVANH